MEKDLVSIVILNYNGKEFLEDCINSIKLETRKKYDLIECSKKCEQYGYDEINLNVGCPSDRVLQTLELLL